MALPVIIIVVSMVIAIAAFKAKMKEEQKRTSSSPGRTMLNPGANKQTPLRSAAAPAQRKTAPGGTGKSEKSKPQKVKYDGMAAFRSLENRSNDWLARQLREEKQKERLYSEMYGLKRRHEENCAADRLRREHERVCDADGVDTGRA